MAAGFDDSIPYLSGSARAIVGAALLSAGLAKAFGTRPFAAVLLRFPITSFAMRSTSAALKAARVLSTLEISLGFLFFLGVFGRAVQAAVLLLLIAFTVGVALVLIRRQTLACGCFGTASTENVKWLTLLRDLILIALALVAGVSWTLSVDGLIADHVSLNELAAYESVAVSGILGILLLGSFSRLRSNASYVRHIPRARGGLQSEVWEGTREDPLRLRGLPS